MTSLQLILLGAQILGSLHGYTLPIATQVVCTMSCIEFQVPKFRYCVQLYTMYWVNYIPKFRYRVQLYAMYWVNYLNLGIMYIPVNGLIVILPLSSAH